MTKGETLTYVRAFGRLEGTVTEGFESLNARIDKEIIPRLDHTNGTIQEHEKEIDKLKITNSYQAGKRKGTAMFWGILGTILGLLIGLLTIFAQSGCWNVICPK